MAQVFSHFDEDNRLDFGITHQRQLGTIFNYEASLLAEVQATHFFDRNNNTLATAHLEAALRNDNTVLQAGALIESRDEVSAQAYAQASYLTRDQNWILSGKAFLEKHGNDDPNFGVTGELLKAFDIQGKEIYVGLEVTADNKGVTPGLGLRTEF